MLLRWCLVLLLTACTPKAPVVSYHTLSNATVVLLDTSNFSMGTGTVYEIFPDNWIILTAEHVVENTQVILVKTAAGEITLAHVVYRNPRSDFAILKIDKVAGVIPLAFQPGYVHIGDKVTMVAHPNANYFSYMELLVSNVQPHRVMYQGGIWKGTSGASVFDSEGRFVGIISHIDRDNTTLLPQFSFSFLLDPEDFEAIILEGVP
jgi:S1-C subfamily serine protease